MARPKTPNQGAGDERTAILAHVRRQVKKSADTTIDGGVLIQWLLNRDLRYNKKTKGLGR